MAWAVVGGRLQLTAGSGLTVMTVLSVRKRTTWRRSCGWRLAAVLSRSRCQRGPQEAPAPLPAAMALRRRRAIPDGAARPCGRTASMQPSTAATPAAGEGAHRDFAVRHPRAVRRLGGPRRNRGQEASVARPGRCRGARPTTPPQHRAGSPSCPLSRSPFKDCERGRAGGIQPACCPKGACRIAPASSSKSQRLTQGSPRPPHGNTGWMDRPRHKRAEHEHDRRCDRSQPPYRARHVPWHARVHHHGA